MAQTKLPYQKVIRVNDTVLITSLFCYGIRALEGYRQSPNYEICFLFFDNAETKRSNKKVLRRQTNGQTHFNTQKRHTNF